MFTFSALLIATHLIGLALGVGSATVKLALLFKCNSNYDFVPVFIKVTKPIAKFIKLGLIVMTLSGIGLLFMGYSFTPMLIVKVIIVGVIWVLGSLIEKVVEPRFEKLAPLPRETASTAFVRIQKQHLVLEITGTSLFYAITIMGVLL